MCEPRNRWNDWLVHQGLRQIVLEELESLEEIGWIARVANDEFGEPIFEWTAEGRRVLAAMPAASPAPAQPEKET